MGRLGIALIVIGACLAVGIGAIAAAPASTDHELTANKLRAELKKERHAADGWKARAVRNQRNALRWKTAVRNDGSVNEALVLASRVYGVPLSQMRSVAWCESRLFAGARNGQYRGLFQEGPMFERGPFGDLSVWSPYANAFTAAYTVSREGWRQWECRP